MGGDEGDEHEVLTGEYDTWVGSWSPSELPAGQKLKKPGPLFKKLDPGVVVPEELERMQKRAAEE